MKSIAIPKFSERYLAHADAERQYVFGNRQEARPAGKNGGAASESGIEAAFRLVRTQNRRSDAAPSN